MKETKDCFIGLLSDSSDWLAELGFYLQKFHFKTTGVMQMGQARLLVAMTRPEILVTDDITALRAFASEKIPVLYVARSMPPRLIRDQIIKRLFPAPSEPKRFFRRIPVEFTAFVELPDLEGQYLNATVYNISRRGGFVRPKELLPEKGDVVRLEFTCFDSEPFTFEALGIVRWCSPQQSEGAGEMEGFGVEFVSLSEVSSEYLTGICRPVRDSEKEPDA